MYEYAPTPWTASRGMVSPLWNVKDANGNRIAQGVDEGAARVIAAAPELFKAAKAGFWVLDKETFDNCDGAWELLGQACLKADPALIEEG